MESALLSGVPQWFWLALAFVYGSIIGSFLNVVIYRIPKGIDIVRKPSHCTSCGEKIPWYLNIPIVSWFILRGKTACCGEKLSFRYPLVEIAAAILTAALFAEHGLSFRFLHAWLFACFILVLLTIDWETMRLPNVLTLPGVAIGLAFAFAGEGAPAIDALVGIAVGAGGFYVIALFYKIARGFEGMGMGDVKLMAMVGAFLGWQKTLLVIITGSVLGLLFGVIMIALKRGDSKTRLPFGTFLGVAALIVLLWGEPLLAWYLGIFNIPGLQSDPSGPNNEFMY